MIENRAFGHVRAPDAERVLAYAERHHLHLDPGRLAFLTGVVAGVVEGVNRLDEFDQPEVPLRHTDRDPGRPPKNGEDPYKPRALLWAHLHGSRSTTSGR